MNDEKWRKTIIEIKTPNPSRLPVRDFATYANDTKLQEFGFNLGLVCFA